MRFSIFMKETQNSRAVGEKAPKDIPRKAIDQTHAEQMQITDRDIECRKSLLNGSSDNEQAGKHFDPQLVEKFNEILPDILAIKNQFSDKS